MTSTQPETELDLTADESVDVQSGPKDPDLPRDVVRSANLRPILWRLHFIGGIVAAPVVLSLAITGILFAWNPQIDDLRFGETINAPTEDVNVSLADQLLAAQDAYPSWDVYSVTPGTGGENTAIMMDPPGGEQGFGGPADGVYVYVDQADGTVTGDVAKEDLSGSVLRGWHSSFGIGERAEPLTELAGSWFVVSLLTGVYLWWPSLRRFGRRSVSWRRKDTTRATAKARHNAVGILLLVPMLVLGVTGLTWTQYAGERVDMFKEAVGADARAEPVSLPSPAPNQTDIGNVDIVYAAAQNDSLVAPVRIIAPTEQNQPWDVSSRDSTYPLERDQLLIDGSTGDIVQRTPYADEHWFNKLRTAGILFHQAELFGPPLQVFLTIVAVGVIALVLFGYKMWWARRPSGGLGTPPAVRGWWRNAPIPILVAAVALAWLLPVLGVSMLIFLAVEALIRAARSFRHTKPLSV